MSETTDTILVDQGGGDDAPVSTGREWLPEAYREDASFKDLADINALAKSYKETKSFVGADKAQLLKIPKTDDAPEWGEVWSKLGRPEKPEDYKLTFAEGVAEEDAAFIAKKMHEAGFTSKHAQAAATIHAEVVKGLQARQQEEILAKTDQVRADLQREWGQAFDDRVHSIQRLIVNNGGDDALKAFNESGAGRDPAVLKMLAKIADAFSEPSTLRGGSGGGMGRAMTPAEAQAEIRKLQADPEFMKQYTQRGDGHDEALRRMGELFGLAHPSA